MSHARRFLTAHLAWAVGEDFWQSHEKARWLPPWNFFRPTHVAIRQLTAISHEHHTAGKNTTAFLVQLARLNDDIERKARPHILILYRRTDVGKAEPASRLAGVHDVSTTSGLSTLSFPSSSFLPGRNARALSLQGICRNPGSALLLGSSPRLGFLCFFRSTLYRYDSLVSSRVASSAYS